MKAKTYNDGCPPGGTAPAANYKTSASGQVTVSGCTIPDGTNAWIAAVTAGVCAIIVTAGLKLVIRLVNRDLAALEAADAEEAAAEAAAEAAINGVTLENGGAAAGAAAAKAEIDAKAAQGDGVDRGNTPTMLQGLRKSKVWTTLTYGSKVDIHETVKNDPKLKAMHAEAEVFDRKTELSFKYLQVLTA